MKKPRVLIKMNTGTRIHGDTEYNRRKMDAQKEIQDSLTEQKVEQYYSFRNGCNCPELEILWNLINYIDGLASKCTEYAEDAINNEKRKNDPIFMNAFEKLYNQWKHNLEQYPNLLMELHLQDYIKVQTFVDKKGEKTPIKLEDGVRISTSLLHPIKKEIVTEMSCNYCNTRLPKIEYQDWF